MQTRMTVVCTLFFAVYTPDAKACESDKRLWIVVQAASVDERSAITHKGLCIEEISDEWVAGIIEPDNIEELIKSGFIIEQAMPLEDYASQIVDAETTRSNYQFSTFEHMIERLQNLVATHNEVVELYSIGKSCEGRDLWMLRLAAKKQTGDKPGILFVGTHHAREHLSTELCLYLANYICEHKNNPTITQLLNSVDIYIMPMLNPDGVVYDFSKNSFAYWRKNRHINHDRSIGVDLNRNYGYFWSGAGRIAVPSSENYGGPKPFSEPETEALKSFLKNHNNIKIFIAYHSYGKYILYPWGYTKNGVEDQRDKNLYTQLGQKLASITGYKAIQAGLLYVAPGDAVDYAYGAHKIISYTIELMPQANSGSSGFYPTNHQAINEDISKNIDAALYLCGICHNPYSILTA